MGASATPIAVFLPDERRALPQAYGSLDSKIGMLYEQSTQTLCTAFCVAPGMIATAAHCLFQPKNGQLPKLSDVTFRLSYGKTLLSSGIADRNTPYAKNSISVGTTSFSNEPPLSAPKDWAIIKLEKPVCRFGVLRVEPLSVAEVIEKAEEKKVFQVAYHWDREDWQRQLAYSTPCEVRRDFDQIKWRFIRQHFINPDELLLHTCDTGGASSGSPILYDPGLPNNPDTPVVVGINVGTYTRTRILLRQGRIFKRLKPDIIANTGVSSATFQRVIPIMEEAEIIANQPDMLKLQTELQMRGYYIGNLDGQLGRTTRAAIINFENANGMTLTGLPTQGLLRRLDEDQGTPSHMFSNARAPIGNPPQVLTQPAALPEPLPPQPLEPPPLPVRKPQVETPPAESVEDFDPFGTR